MIVDGRDRKCRGWTLKRYRSVGAGRHLLGCPSRRGADSGRILCPDISNFVEPSATDTSTKYA